MAGSLSGCVILSDRMIVVVWHAGGTWRSAGIYDTGATASHVLVQISRLQCRKGRLPISLSLRHTSERPYYRSIILSPCYGQLPTDPVPAAADEEMKVPSVENPELTNVLLFKPGVGQNMATRALIACCQECLPCLNFDLPATFTFIF